MTTTPERPASATKVHASVLSSVLAAIAAVAAPKCPACLVATLAWLGLGAGTAGVAWTLWRPLCLAMTVCCLFAAWAFSRRTRCATRRV